LARHERVSGTDSEEQAGGSNDRLVEARVQQPELATRRRDGNGVLQRATGVGVVLLDAHRCGAEGRAEGAIVEHGTREVAQPLVRDVFGEELEKALEVVDVAAGAGRELERIGRDLGLLDGAHDDLRTAAVLLHAAQHANDVANLEAPIKDRGVVEDRGLHAAGLIRQLEREVRRARARAASILANDGKRRVDELAFDKITDGGTCFCAHMDESRRVSPRMLSADTMLRL
jgi:hypothetical protein